MSPIYGVIQAAGLPGASIGDNMPPYKTFAEALSATPRPAATAANDNRPRKAPEPKYRGTLPALRWLFDNHPDEAAAMARAVDAVRPDCDAPVQDGSRQDIQPSIGELLDAAATGHDEAGNRIWAPMAVESHSAENGGSVVHLGALRFRRGEMIEFGRTRKGRQLRPRDRLANRDDKTASAPRNIAAYLALRPTTPSPMAAEPLPRNVSGEPAIASMYDPLPGVTANRTELRKMGVDGEVPHDALPVVATMLPAAIAKGASFLGGVSGLSGTGSSGVVGPYDAPERPKGEIRQIVEAVAAGATLKDIGEKMGLKGGHAIRTAGEALVNAAKALMSANDNFRKKISA